MYWEGWVGVLARLDPRKLAPEASGWSPEPRSFSPGCASLSGVRASIAMLPDVHFTFLCNAVESEKCQSFLEILSISNT